MTLEDFNSRYIYKADKNYDDWSICKLGEDGYYRNDCESYVLTLLKFNLADGDITWTTIGGEGHVVLVDKDRFIDCNNKAWTLIVDKPKTYGKFRKMYLPEIWLRKLKGYVLGLFKTNT